MPIVRMGTKLVYFAHVPKCGGSSIEDYLRQRFGRLALLDRRYLSGPPDARWSRTSPQHVDWATLMQLFPEDFFADTFVVVRHPVDRAISAYRFQAEVEGTVAVGMGFGDWLHAEAEARQRDPHRSDNHSRPQTEFVPPPGRQDCTVFHLEHGLDALIPYFDTLAGEQSGPRAMSHLNKATRRPSGRVREIGPVVPTAEELALVARLYAADFACFGYVPDRKAPLAPAPVLNPDFLARNVAARVHAARPLQQLVARARRRLWKWVG